MLKFFDSHAHYDDRKFDDDRDEILKKLPSLGVLGIINAASNIKSAIKSINFAKKYDYIYTAVGIHPHDAGSAPDNYINEIKKLAEFEKNVAIGEIGLDYHYDFSPRDAQKSVFTEQLKLANELNLPVIIHDREAHADILNALNEFKPKGVIHCFSGSVNMMYDVVKLGMYIGLGGAVTFKNAKTPLEVAKEIPLDRLLLETDAPYMSPVPMRGKRCDSSMIAFTAEKIAEVKSISLEELYNATNENCKRLFNINF
jgi:hydrolase, TatD family